MTLFFGVTHDEVENFQVYGVLILINRNRLTEGYGKEE